MHELILYATPLGPFARSCHDYLRASQLIGPTAAQSYPAHCTLTGFFRRTTIGREAAVGVSAVLPSAVPSAAVAVSPGPVVRSGWVGFELASAALDEAIATFVGSPDTRPDLGAGEDPLRAKSGLHLSLAYGTDDLGPHVTLARRHRWGRIDGWSIALWERLGDRWTCHR